MRLDTPSSVVQLVATRREYRNKQAVDRSARSDFDRLTNSWATEPVRRTRQLTYMLATRHRTKVWGLMKSGLRNEPLEVLNRLADKLDLATAFTEPVTVRLEPKDGGGYRQVCALPYQLKAAHYIIREIITAQTPELPFLYSTKGRGRNELVRDATSLISDGYGHVTVLDIKNCFPSVKPKLLTTLPIHQRFVTNTLGLENLRFRHQDSRRGGTSEATTPCETSYRDTDATSTGAPTGLMQGSPASAAILAWMYRNMPTFDADMGHVLIYVDDILILAKTEASRREIKDAVVRYLSDCPGGPLQLVPSDIGLGDRFHFLGYEIGYEFKGGTRTAVARISHTTLAKLERKLPELIEKDRCGRLGWPHGALEHLQNVLKGHPQAVDREEWARFYFDTLTDYNMSSPTSFE